MSITLPWPRTAARSEQLEDHLVIVRHFARSSLKWAVVWGFVFGLWVMSTIESYIKAYPAIPQRLQIVGSVQSFSFLAGQPHHLETVAGYTVWKVLLTAAIMGAIWGFRTSIGLLRGEEEAGRWELLLTGQTTRQTATMQALLGLGAAFLAMAVTCTLLVLAAGRLPGARFTPDQSLLFSAALLSGALMFLALGAVASQLAATTGQATMLTTAVLAISFLIRGVADSSAPVAWIRWLSPLGWIEEIRPFAGPQPIALLPIIGFVVVCAALAVVLAGRRDLNASILQEREGTARNPRWLVGPTTLAIRLSRPAAIGWLLAIGGYSVLLGYAARSAAKLLSNSPTAVAALGRLGLRRASEGYLGFAFLMAAIIIALVAASQIATIRDEEATGRVDNLLVRPVPRVVWLAGRLGVSLGLIVLAGVAAGVCTWIGAASQHTGLSLATLFEAGVNAAVPAVCVLGAGALLLGLRPRLSVAAVYGLVAWSFIVDLLSALLTHADWLKDSSLFTHIALAPAARPDWGTDGILVLLGLAAAVIGLIAFQRRDLEYI